MLPCIDKEGDNGLFAKRLGGLQPVQTFDEHEARAVRPDEDRRLQTLVENAGRDLVYSLLFEGRTSLGRNVNVSDWDGLALHHDRTKGRPARTCDILNRLPVRESPFYTSRTSNSSSAFASFRSRVSKPAGSSIQRFDERWEGDLIFAFISGPHADLLAALPLNGNQRDQRRSVFRAWVN